MTAVGCCRGCVTGLRILESGTPVPLKSIDVEVAVKGFIASVTATLVYRNTEESPVEAIYEFPMDDQSAVFHFEAQTEGRTIIAECQEKQQAKETYKEALDQGFAATYMEQDDTTTDIFRCKVGNLPPGADMTIKFAYVTELTMQPDGGLTFTLYTLLNPRYNPKPEDGGVANVPNPTYVAKGDSQPYAFTFRARINNVAKISGVTCKDELTVTFNEAHTEATVGLAKPFLADHDLSVDIKYEEVDKPHAIIEAGNAAKDGLLKHDVIMLNFFPNLADTDYSNNHEFIFVIDRSGSMGGPRITSAKDTLLLFLKSLPAGCYFDIIGFGSEFAHLFPDGSKEYSEESLNAAMTYQKQLEADFGGTEILAPLKDIYSKPPMTSHSRQVFLLTDGEVYNTAEIIDLVRKNSVNTRVFTFGIGEGASTTLVKGVARAGRGKAEFIKENERMQPLVIKTLKAAMQTGVSDLTLDWQLGGSPKLTQVPQEFPPLFGGDRLIVYAVSADQGVLDGRVVLRGKIGARSLEYPLDVSGAAVRGAGGTGSEEETLPIHRLAAKAQIQLLQDQEKDDAEQNKAAIVLLSLASNIVSRHTAMVGVDKERSDKVTGQRTVRQVPVMQDPTLRYGAMPMMAACCAPAMMRSCAAPAVGGGGGFSFAAGTSYQMDMCMDGAPAPRSADPMEEDEAPEGQQKKEVTYMSVVELQTFAGSWKLTAELATVINVSLDKLQAAAPVKSGEVWGTVLALAVLTDRYGAQRDEWEMVEHKARQWLGTQDLEGKDLAALLASATAAIHPPAN